MFEGIRKFFKRKKPKEQPAFYRGPAASSLARGSDFRRPNYDDKEMRIDDNPITIITGTVPGEQEFNDNQQSTYEASPDQSFKDEGGFGGGGFGGGDFGGGGSSDSFDTPDSPSFDSGPASSDY